MHMYIYIYIYRERERDIVLFVTTASTETLNGTCVGCNSPFRGAEQKLHPNPCRFAKHKHTMKWHYKQSRNPLIAYRPRPFREHSFI